MVYNFVIAKFLRRENAFSFYYEEKPKAILLSKIIHKKNRKGYYCVIVCDFFEDVDWSYIREKIEAYEGKILTEGTESKNSIAILKKHLEVSYFINVIDEITLQSYRRLKDIENLKINVSNVGEKEVFLSVTGNNSDVAKVILRKNADNKIYEMNIRAILFSFDRYDEIFDECILNNGYIELNCIKMKLSIFDFNPALQKLLRNVISFIDEGNEASLTIEKDLFSNLVLDWKIKFDQPINIEETEGLIINYLKRIPFLN
jgi:hypothetical protein